MAQDMESAVERSEGPSVRDTVEAAYASHTASPDTTSIVNGAIADRDREIRTRDRAAPRDAKQYEGDPL